MTILRHLATLLAYDVHPITATAADLAPLAGNLEERAAAAARLALWRDHLLGLTVIRAPAKPTTPEPEAPPPPAPKKRAAAKRRR